MSYFLFKSLHLSVSSYIIKVNKGWDYIDIYLIYTIKFLDEYSNLRSSFLILLSDMAGYPRDCCFTCTYDKFNYVFNLKKHSRLISFQDIAEVTPEMSKRTYQKRRSIRRLWSDPIWMRKTKVHNEKNTLCAFYFRIDKLQTHP